MHELSFAAALLEEVEAIARSNGAAQVLRVHCRMGCLRQVDESLLREAFAVVAKGTCAEGADLQVTRQGMTLQCLECGRASLLAGWQFACPACESTRIELSGGEESELTSVELEVDDENRSLEEEPFCEQRAGRGRESEPLAEA